MIPATAAIDRVPIRIDINAPNEKRERVIANSRREVTRNLPRADCPNGLASKYSEPFVDQSVELWFSVFFCDFTDTRGDSSSISRHADQDFRSTDNASAE